MHEIWFILIHGFKNCRFYEQFGARLILKFAKRTNLATKNAEFESDSESVKRLPKMFIHKICEH